jgi:hypothetical protein
MYEYIADFERWKITSDEYLNKYIKVQEITNNCISNCKDEICTNLCKKPIIDIHKFSSEMIKKATLDIYELCTSKTKNITDLPSRINKTKKCVELLYNDNEKMIKREIVDRLDDIYKYLT